MHTMCQHFELHAINLLVSMHYYAQVNVFEVFIGSVVLCLDSFTTSSMCQTANQINLKIKSFGTIICQSEVW